MNRVFTEKEISEIQAAEAVLRDSGLDVDHEHANHNANIIMDYFEKNPQMPVTVQSIRAVVDSQKTSFVWRTPAQREYDKIAAENPTAAAQLANWFATQGRPGTLENTGDFYFQNSSNLLQELRGREVTTETIAAAIGRIGAPASRFDTRKRPPLHYLPESRPMDPRQKQDDGIPFLGRDVNEPRWKRIQREREEREARDAASRPSASSVASVAVREAKQKADSLTGATHSETDQLKRIYVTTPGTSEINWPDTLAARLQMQKQFDKHREVSRFIR
jgi:hypothetical protein